MRQARAFRPAASPILRDFRSPCFGGWQPRCRKRSSFKYRLLFFWRSFECLRQFLFNVILGISKITNGLPIVSRLQLNSYRPPIVDESIVALAANAHEWSQNNLSRI